MIAAAIDALVLRTLGIYLVCLVISIGVHEYFHALAANWLGDGTPEAEGRLTLNPLAHADPIGTFTMPVVAALFSLPLLGWGKPVPTQPRYYSRKVSMRTGLALVAVAGPLGNLVVAAVTLLVAGIARAAGVLNGPTTSVLHLLLRLNVLLMAFNLIPLHPLDGGKILAAALPESLRHVDEFLEQWGGLLVIGLVIAGGGILAALVAPIYMAADYLFALVVGLR